MWVLTNTISKDIIKISLKKVIFMRTAPSQIAFRYRPQDSSTGITRITAKRLANTLGVDETQVIHLALYALAIKFLPQYEPDDGPLSKSQLSQIKKSALKAKGGTVRSSLFEA